MVICLIKTFKINNLKFTLKKISKTKKVDKINEYKFITKQMAK